MNLETEIVATNAIDAVVEGTSPWCVIHGDNSSILPLIPDKSVAHVITDPPYTEHTHVKSRIGSSLSDLDGVAAASRVVDFGFAHITEAERTAVAQQVARLAYRWLLFFTDCEGLADWRRAILDAGLQHIRSGTWVKLHSTPQFTGDRPGTGVEMIEIAHPKGRKKWNGGGKPALWTHAIAIDRSKTGEQRIHTTQKPVSLMLELVEQFTDPGDIVLDPFCGSGTTGVACLRLGRRFIGIEKDAKYATVAQERLAAESQGLNLRDARAGQLPMFGGAK